MNRRQLLRKTGAVAIGGLLATGTATAREEGTAPNDRVDTESVSIFAPESDPKQVDAGSWLEHRWGWLDVAGGDSTEEDVQRYLDAVELSIFIDGEPVSNPDRYWGEIQQNEDGQYVVWWEYVTPPKSPGLHTFTVEASYPDGYEDLSDGDEDTYEQDIPPGTEKAFTGHYEVTGGRRR